MLLVERNEKVKYRNEDDTTILSRFGEVFILNETGSLIWQLLSRERPFITLLRYLFNFQGKISNRRIINDVKIFIEELANIGLVKISYRHRNDNDDIFDRYDNTSKYHAPKIYPYDPFRRGAPLNISKSCVHTCSPILLQDKTPTTIKTRGGRFMVSGKTIKIKNKDELKSFLRKNLIKIVEIKLSDLTELLHPIISFVKANNFDTILGIGHSAIPIIKFLEDAFKSQKFMIENIATFNFSPFKSPAGKLNEELKDIFCMILNKNILLIDDVCDSGLTFSLVTKELRRMGAKNIKTAVLVSTNNYPVDIACLKPLKNHYYICEWEIDLAKPYR